MAHNINYNKERGMYSFATAKELAWHKLGQVIDHKMTTREAIEYALLDYKVEKADTFALIGDQYVEIPNTMATFRTDNNAILTKNGKMVTKQYQVMQNIEAFSFFDNIIKQGDAIIEIAGALGDGEIVFITAKLDPMQILNDDVVDNYILLTLGHDSSMSIQAMYTPIRVVCNNTLSAALDNNKYKVNIRHSLNASEQLKNAHKLMGIMSTDISNMSNVYYIMANTRITEKESKSIIKNVFLTPKELSDLANGKNYSETISTRKDNILNTVEDYLYTGIGQDTESAKGTVWGTYNAITGYMQNVKTYRSDNDKAIAMIKGDYLNKINKAFSESLKFINI